MTTKIIFTSFLLAVMSCCCLNIVFAQSKEKIENSKYTHKYIPTLNSLAGNGWSNEFTVPGIVSGPVNSMTTDGTNIYVGGQFTVAGGEVANNVVMWNGNSWNSIGEGLENGVNGTVDGLAFINGKLFVGGNFSKAGSKAVNGIAYWDGAEWNALGNDSTNGVRRWDISWGGDTLISAGSIWSMGLYNNYVVFGGFFNLVGTDSTDGIGGWNVLTEEWETFNGGLSNEYPDDPPYAFAFAESGNDLYVGGKFIDAGNVPAKGFAKWNGIEWSEVGGGVNNWVRDMTFDDQGNLYIVGMFDSVGTIHASGIAKWDGTTWSTLGDGILPHPSASHPDVISVEIFDNEIFVGGGFNTAGNVTVSGIAKWNGISWEGVGSGLGFAANNNLGVARELQRLNNQLFIGGNFTIAGDILLSGIVAWNNNSEQYIKLSDGTLEKGIFDGQVYAVAYSGSDVYVGGNFSTAGGVIAKSIAKLTSTGWEPLGTGTNGTINTIYVDGEDVYVGGSFGMAGNDTAFHIAKWNGSEWSSVGIGVGGVANAHVNIITKIGNYIYTGGFFAIVGDSVNYALPANSIARFNLISRTWEALGGGLELFQGFPAFVYCIDGDENKVYAGGQINLADGVAVKSLALWESNNWKTVGEPGNDGVEGVVYDIKKVNEDLYIGGDFTRSGNGNTNSLVIWNGSDWNEVNGGIQLTISEFENPYVSALEFENNKLFIAGNFDKAGDADVANIAIWDGAWQNPGGVNNLVYDMDVSTTNLFIGGGFTVVGGAPSVSVGSYNILTSIDNNDYTIPSDYVLFQNYPNPFNPTTTIKYALPFESNVKILVYNILGEVVSELVNTAQGVGYHEVVLNANNLASGVYICSIQAKSVGAGKDFTSVKKMILMK